MNDKSLIIKKLQELRELTSEQEPHLSLAVEQIIEQFDAEKKAEAAWEKVMLARHTDRPTTLDYISMISDRFIELHGDRCFSDDHGLVGGIAEMDGLPFTFIGHQKGHKMRESIYRNYGMAHPEGYRKALRLAKQAEQFHRLIVTFIDTPGAYPGVGAEERGIAESIARNLKEFSVLRTPIISIVTGEGASGGALGIGVGDKLYMLENSTFSVISPEGFASILLRDPAKAEYASSLLKMTAQDIHGFGLIHGIIPEASGGAHINAKVSAEAIKNTILRDGRLLLSRNPEQLVRYRSRKIRNIDHSQGQPMSKQLFSLFSRIPWLRNLQNDDQLLKS